MMSGGSEAIARANFSENIGVDDLDLAAVSCVGFVSNEASLLGNMRCWIQYDVPPTTMGTWFLLCVSSI